MSDRGRILELRFKNFKSFSGKHRIGPFLDFTSIIGPNGGGKSNVMDAVSFVLGIRSADLRASNLKELIYRKENEKISENIRDAYVKLYFMNAEENRLVFKRSIAANGSGDYFINKNKETSEVYQEVLQDLNILVKAKNFLIFQGQVDSLAMKSGRELTLLFEKISGSEDFKQKYEQTKTDVEVCEENLKSVNARINLLTADKKKLKEQKVHARNYENLVKKIKDLQSTYYLLQFSGIEREIDRKRKILETKLYELDTLRKNKESCFLQLRESNLNLKQTEQKLININDDMLNKNGLMLTKKPELTKMQENIRQIEARIQTKQETLEKMQMQIQRDSKRANELRNEQKIFEEEIDKQQKMLDDEMKIAINDNKKAKYLHLKKEFGIRTFAEKKELERSSKELYTKEINGSMISQQLKEKINEKDKIENEAAALKKSQEKKIAERKNFEALRAQALRELTAASSENEQLRLQESDLLKKLETLDAKLRDYKIVETCNSDKDREKAIITDMIRHKKGVKGLFGDLIRPIQPKYQIALQASLGPILNYLVVDTVDTAQYVNQKLRDHGLVKDVLVLENIPEVHTSETLRQSVGRFGSLMTDVITFEKDYGLEKAVALLVGNKALADNLENANVLRQIKGIRFVVTIDGICIKKGTISSAPKKNYSEKFSQKRVDIEKEAEAVKNELISVQQFLRGENTVGVIRQNIENYSNCITSLENEINYINKRALESLISKSQELSSQIRDLQSQLSLIQSQTETIRKAVSTLEDSIRKVETSMFKDFCIEMGISSIKALEGRDLDEENKIQSKISMLKKEATKVAWSLQSINLEQQQESYLKLEESIQKDERDSEKLKAKFLNIEQEYEKLTELSSALRDQEGYLKDQVNKQKDLSVSLQKNYDTVIKSCTKSEKETSNEERDLEHLNQQKKQKLEELFVKNLEIPLINRGDCVDVDFSKLESKYMQISMEDIDKEAEEISKTIEKETKNLEALVAQGKCTFQEDKYKELEMKLEEANKQLEEYDKKSKEAKAEFLQSKEKRRACFMNTFDLVANNISRIYKEMTKTEKNTYYGGNALLYVDNSEEPYNGGVIYSPTPPGKRCMYEMDQLSGGEKTMAALSLLFSIHSAMPSPFYIMDEVDAFLDWENCQLLLNYLQKVSEEQSQVIIITHKEEFFSNSDCLIGTTYVPSENTSKSFSFDLRPYGPKQINVL